MIKETDILLPVNDRGTYGCVACDQFTGDPDYWREADRLAGDEPSTLRLIFPEIYLSDDPEGRTKKINETMEDYLASGVFRTVKDTMIYVRRTLFDGRVREGLVAACDLEEYSYARDTRSAIRPTEGTIEDRLPPRVKIRKNAPLELPHIMLLVDDPEKTLIEPLKDKGEKVYDTGLMLSGGHLTGYALDAPAIAQTKEALSKLWRGTDGNKLLIAVGDGNHSLATAKKCWEEKKKTLPREEWESDPARYALCEIVNLHSDALEFEPIHRVLFGVTPAEVRAALKPCPGGQKITLVTGGKEETLEIEPTHFLPVGSAENAIRAFLETHPGARVDYIHEDEQVRKLAMQENNVGILLPALSKHELFPAVLDSGVLPRKTFSMGMGRDKRYYYEARKIK